MTHWFGVGIVSVGSDNTLFSQSIHSSLWISVDSILWSSLVVYGSRVQSICIQEFKCKQSFKTFYVHCVLSRCFLLHFYGFQLGFYTLKTLSFLCLSSEPQGHKLPLPVCLECCVWHKKKWHEIKVRGQLREPAELAGWQQLCWNCCQAFSPVDIQRT